MTFHILVPDNLDKAGLDILKAADGFSVQAAPKMSRDELLAAAPAADALIIRSASKVDGTVMDAAPQLTVVGRAGVGVDNIDLEAATARGIVVMNAPDGNTVATAELAIGLMLALARHIPQAEISIRAGQWEKKAFMGVELRRKTLGIVGFGRIGRAVARRAKAFDMTVIAHDPFGAQDAADALGVELVSLDALFARADFITLHAAASASTRNLINAETIQKMKPGVRIVNDARGSLIDEAALAEALTSGRVAGAALDVYSTEPVPADNPLLGLPNVIHTPHLGASTFEAQDEVATQIAHQVIDALTAHDYRNVVNPEVLKRIQA